MALFNFTNKPVTKETSFGLKEALVRKTQRIEQLERHVDDTQKRGDARVLEMTEKHDACLQIVQTALEAVLQLCDESPEFRVKVVQAKIKAKNALCVIHEDKIRQALTKKGIEMRSAALKK